jgi:hypothetical protein
MPPKIHSFYAMNKQAAAAMLKKCPRCGFDNSNAAARCVCGCDLSEVFPPLSEPYAPEPYGAIGRSHSKVVLLGKGPLLCSIFGNLVGSVIVALAFNQGLSGGMGGLGLPTLAGMIALFFGPISGGLMLTGLTWGSIGLARTSGQSEVRGRGAAWAAVVLGGLSFVVSLVLLCLAGAARR